jgi:two-component system, chemotaxis family, CheB/CheR fusion protein
MGDVGVDSLEDYRDLLEVNGEEFTELFNTILINVTNFFRDKPAWDYLAEKVVPALVEGRRAGEPIRVWSAGCAAGQEAYTIAMVLAEALGPGELRDQIKIYATDIDDDALAQARVGAYTTKELADLPDGLRDRYFEPAGTRYNFRGALRRAVIFGRHVGAARPGADST